MNSLKYTVENDFPDLVETKKVYAALSFAWQARNHPERRPRFLQHIGTTAKKCQFLASRSLDSEVTVVFTPSQARPGNAKLFGFPLARDLTAFGRAQADS
ncbi:hypothetical protein [Rhizobium sp. Root73]|nr:hypothetical protein [Rhizobium sp. Root73]